MLFGIFLGYLLLNGYKTYKIFIEHYSEYILSIGGVLHFAIHAHFAPLSLAYHSRQRSVGKEDSPRSKAGRCTRSL